MGYWKMSAPLILLWIYSMAFGNGITSGLFGHWIVTSLAPLGYPIYLLHYGVARFYWLATRGLKAQSWWPEAGIHPFPVEWYEYFVVLGISIVLGYVVNRWLVPILMPRTISWGVAVCSWLSERGSRLIDRCARCCCRGGDEESDTDEASNDDQPISSKSTFDWDIYLGDKSYSAKLVNNVIPHLFRSKVVTRLRNQSHP